jgi:pimeloyl-ACP methyl ester carboxylesterase
MNRSFLPGQIVALNGMQMYYVTCGQGEPLLLLHGFTGSSSDWEPFVSELAEEYQLILPDLRGHGRSANPLKEFTHRQAALDMWALLDHLGIEHFKAIGASGGGNILLHLATQQPGRVAAMVLISATSSFPEQAREAMARVTIESQTDEAWYFMRQRHIHGDEQIRALWRQGQAFKDSYDDMNFTASSLSTITAQTLVVYGDRDFLYPVQIALDMYTAIPHSYLWIVPNGGHVPLSSSLHEPFMKTVLPFLRGDWERG